jgi:protein TonB
MKKNSLLLGTLGLSAALHGLALIGAPGGLPRAAAPGTEPQSVSTLKMIKVGARPRQTESVRSVEKTPEKRIVEKSVEPPPEIIPVEESAVYEDTQNDGRAEYNGEAREGGEDGVNDDSARDNGTITDREYAALLAYIKDFISKNLVYPAMAKRRNIEGIVGVYFEIDGNGAISAITVYNSSGSPLLDNAAVTLVRRIQSIKNITVNRELVLKVNIDYKLTE